LSGRGRPVEYYFGLLIIQNGMLVKVKFLLCYKQQLDVFHANTYMQWFVTNEGTTHT